ncbi:MAG: hypothetical protein KC425_27385 [Anaerolineales bacterium]|nr:hypothetical protein [Anaerolineales bacterium]
MMHPRVLRVSDLLQFGSATICPLIFVALVTTLLGLFVFGPLQARSALQSGRFRFRLVDIAILVAQMQIAGGVIWALPRPRGSILLQYGLILATWVLLIWWWVTGVRMLSRARIEHGLQRIGFLAFFLPLGYMGALGLLAAPITVVLTLTLLGQIAAGGPRTDASTLGLVALANVVVVASIVAVRRYCRMMTTKARDDYARDEGIEFGAVGAGRGMTRPFSPMASDREVRFLEDARTDARDSDH